MEEIGNSSSAHETFSVEQLCTEMERLFTQIQNVQSSENKEQLNTQIQNLENIEDKLRQLEHKLAMVNDTMKEYRKCKNFPEERSEQLTREVLQLHHEFLELHRELLQLHELPSLQQSEQ